MIRAEAEMLVNHIRDVVLFVLAIVGAVLAVGAIGAIALDWIGK